MQHLLLQDWLQRQHRVPHQALLRRQEAQDHRRDLVSVDAARLHTQSRGFNVRGVGPNDGREGCSVALSCVKIVCVLL